MKAMPVATTHEILDGFKFHHNGHIYVAYDEPNDEGHACGYDEKNRECDLYFVWTVLDCWVFLDANLAEHEVG